MNLSLKKVSKQNRISVLTTALLMVLSAMLLSCGDSSKNNTSTFKTDLNLPESLTGRNANTFASPQDQPKHTMARGVENFVATTQTDKEDLFQCRYIGPEEDDIFKNGYNMAKFMISAVATWSCIGDSLIYISSVLPHDNKVRETEHDGSAPNYNPEEPSHYKISDGENGKVEVALYYGYSHSEPLPNDAVIGFYFAWNELGEQTIGRMIIDAVAVDNPKDDEDDPVKVRMDFDYGTSTKKADMYMVFDENNIWANGFRIQVTKDLMAANDEKVFTAIGKMDMKAQFAPASGITEVPVFDVYTVSNAAGNGAAIAEFTDLALPLGEVGNYIADKIDIYFFDENSDWNYINKSFSNGEMRGNTRTLSPGEEDFIENELGLAADYFTNTCDQEFDDCNALINEVFENGFDGQEENQGSDPDDWRSVEIGNSTYLDSVFPEGGSDWDGVFDYSF